LHDNTSSTCTLLYF